MRPIKFRAWDEDLKEMFYTSKGDFCIGSKGNACFFDTDWKNKLLKGGFIKKDGTHKLKILMQFTGLCDRNGTEIYEGDILRYPPKNEWEKLNYPAFEIFFHDGDCASVHIGFQMNRMHFHGAIAGWGLTQGFVPNHTKKLEVIGNIHQNKELLESQCQQDR